MRGPLQSRGANAIIYVFLTAMAFVVIYPIFVVAMNSFKGRFFMSLQPFTLPSTNSENATFVGMENCASGIEKGNFVSAFGYSSPLRRPQ